MSFLTFDGDSSDTFLGAETVAGSGSIRTSVACLDLFDNNFVAAIGASVSVDSDASIFLQINSILETVQKKENWRNREWIVVKTYNLTSGLGLPLTWSIKEAVESVINSELSNLTR